MATVSSGLNSGSGFANSDVVTSTNLNNHVNSATITNIVAADISSDAITTAKIANSSSKTTGVTFAKMQHISTAKVLGRISASEGDVEEAFDFKDEDDMSSNSATALASQQSIKAYVDQDKCLVTSTTSSITIGSVPLAVPFDSEISDTAGLHDNSTNNSRITIASAGIYLINGTITTTETDNGDYSIAIYKNGSELTRIYADTGSTSSGQVFNITHIASLSATDYLELFVVAISGNSTAVDGTKSFFSTAGLA